MYGQYEGMVKATEFGWVPLNNLSLSGALFYCHCFPAVFVGKSRLQGVV